jgi:hypothetical protein
VWCRLEFQSEFLTRTNQDGELPKRVFPNWREKFGAPGNTGWPKVQVNSRITRSRIIELNQLESSL